MGISSFFASLFGTSKSRRASGKRGKAASPELDITIPGQTSGQTAPKKATASKRSSRSTKKRTSKRAPTPEDVLNLDGSVARPGGRPERRQSFRVHYPGLICRIKELQKNVRVRDISDTGLGLQYQGPRVKAGTRLHLVLGADREILIKGLVFRVVRHDQGILGGAFEELDRHQKETLAQIVLDAQKRRGKQKPPSAET